MVGAAEGSDNAEESRVVGDECEDEVERLSLIVVEFKFVSRALGFAQLSLIVVLMSHSCADDCKVVVLGFSEQAEVEADAFFFLASNVIDERGGPRIP